MSDTFARITPSTFPEPEIFDAGFEHAAIGFRQRRRRTMQNAAEIGTLGRELATQPRAQAPRAAQLRALLPDVAGEDLVLDIVELMRHVARELLDARRAEVEKLRHVVVLREGLHDAVRIHFACGPCDCS